jgi:hypothetical protein
LSRKKFNRMGWYRRDGTPYPEGIPGIIEASKDLKPENQRVAFDKLDNGVEVSTVWLGLDHNWVEGRRPLIFETMLFVPQYKRTVINGKVWESDKESIGEQWRYATEEEAIRGHKMLVKKWKQFKTADQVLGEKNGRRKPS